MSFVPPRDGLKMRPRALELLVLGALLCPGVAWTAERSASSRVIEFLELGESGRALVLLDSLLREDPSDLVAAYLAAKAEAAEGGEEWARCRYLELEGVAPGTEAALLAGARRRELERILADQQASMGAAWMTQFQDAESVSEGQPAGRTAGRPSGILLLPLDNLGDPAALPGFGLLWSYLLFDRLQGSGLCPVSFPSMLLMQDLLVRGRVVRAPAQVGRLPVNTLGGLRARLSVLPDREGDPYLAPETAGSDAELRAALIHFQRDHTLPSTGEADLGTQRELEAALEGWLLETPSSLTPELLPRAMSVLGSSLALRGTYRVLADRVTVQLTLLDPEGKEKLQAPLVRTFELRETMRAAAEISAELAGALGLRSKAPRPMAKALSSSSIAPTVELLVLWDRGGAAQAESRWERLAAEERSSPLLAGLEAALRLTPEETDRREQALLHSWTRRTPLEPSTALDLLLRDLGGLQRGPLSARRSAFDDEPGPYQLLGRTGLLRIRGEGP